jgi:hypothetical protein
MSEESINYGEVLHTFEELGTEFQKKLLEFNSLADNLSKNELKRVSKALAASPLEEDLIRLVHPNEVDLYNIGIDLRTIKMDMMVKSLIMDQEEAQFKQQNNTQEKGEQNGEE